jgi:hypothetical protein
MNILPLFFPLRRNGSRSQSAMRRPACCWWRALAGLALLVCLSPSRATAQAAAEYGGAVSSAGARVTAMQPSKIQPAVVPNTSAHLATRPAEDTQAANRKALESRAGKDAAKLMLRSEPDKAWVRIDGKAVGRTPLLLIVAPGVYKVEMEGTGMESHRQVDLLPKEGREVLLSLQSRYPSHVQLRWHAQ